MSRKRRDLSEEEGALWRRVSATVKPRRSADLKETTPAGAAKSPPDQRAVAEAPAPSGAPVRPPSRQDNDKRVRRGKLDIGATLDLHGHTQDTARAALARFLRQAQARGERTVIVVTGIGRGGEGVLKRRLPDWLAEGAVRLLVTGFAQAHRSHGGAGAFYVFLKRRAEGSR